jgi:DNA-binding transcriptional MerR regulator
MRIGVLAKASGLSVRTLHHYDAIGLLSADERSQSGQRLYSDANVRRLYRIVALRRLGLSLAEIHAVLEGEPDLLGAVRRHLAQVEASLRAQRRLQRTLAAIVELLEHEREPSVEKFIAAIEEMTMIERYYTPEQLAQLEQRAAELGPERIRAAEREWGELIEAMKAERAAGTPAGDPRVLELARRWQGLVERFTGGDDGIRQSLATMYREQGPQATSRGMVDSELMGYVGEALATLGESK